MNRLYTMLTTLLLAATVNASDLTPVTWIHEASGTEIYVACYWLHDQFPDRDVLAEKHLLLAVRKSTWQDLSNQKQAKIRTAIRKLLRGEVRLTKAKIQAWRDALNDANIKFMLTSDPVGVLRAAGLIPPPDEE